MINKIENALESLENSMQSASAAVAEHIRTVAANGREYSTLEAVECEAQNLIDGAQQFLDEIGRPANKQRYLLCMCGDVEPHLHGPFETEDDRLMRARTLRAEDPDDGLYTVDCATRPDIDAYPANVLDAKS